MTETSRSRSKGSRSRRDGLATERHNGVLNRVITDQRFPLVQLGGAVVAWGLWYYNPSAGWALAIALAPLALRLLGGQVPLCRTPLDVPLGMFLLTAVMGVWAAYDRAGARIVFGELTPVGWQALWGLILAALIFYALAAMETETQHRWALVMFAGLGVAFAVWFAAANDWRANPTRLATIARLGVAIQRWIPPLPEHWLNANIVGGTVATLMPMSLGLVSGVSGRDWRRRWPWIAWGLVTGTVMAFGLVLTVSRGALMGVASSVTLGAAWWVAGRLSWGQRRFVVFLGLVGLGALAGGALVALSPSLRGAIGVRQGLTDRLGIFVQAALLVRDYPFTGFGLGEFALIHSTYALMIHVPILAYAHSLYLDIALGQGALGILAAVGMLGGAAWLGSGALVYTEEPPPVLIAGLLSLVVMTVHGLADDPLYSSLAMPLLWVPAGLVVASRHKIRSGYFPGLRLKAWRWSFLGTVAFFGLVLLLLFWRSVGAAWYANLGAVYQTRAELSHYDSRRFDSPTLDEIRREVDLSAAERCFTRAVALNPGQVTARTRLAQIALGRGQYKRALAHVQAAWDAGHHDRVTRLLLGDALVATGDVEGGVNAVRGIKWAEGRLDGQAWYRYWLGGEYNRAADAWRAVVALNPKNERAAGAIKMAEAKAKSP